MTLHVINLNTGRSYPLELIQLDQYLLIYTTIRATHKTRKIVHLEVNFLNIVAFYQYRPPIERILTNLLDNALKFLILVAVLILFLRCKRKRVISISIKMRA